MSITKIHAHRGASGYTPENTMAAFRKAIELGANAIELDVHMTKDRKLVVIHDEKVDRTTNGSGMVAFMTLEQIKKLDAGSWFSSKYKGLQIPTLREVMDLVKNTPLFLNIEIKIGYRFYPNIEEKIIDLIEEYDMIDRVIISSFDHYSLVRVKEINPHIKTGLLYVASLFEPWEYARFVKVDALHPNYITVTKDFLQNAAINGFPINAYTVNDEKAMRELAYGKIAGIITNYPDKAKEIIEKIQEEM